MAKEKKEKTLKGLHNLTGQWYIDDKKYNMIQGQKFKFVWRAKLKDKDEYINRSMACVVRYVWWKGLTRSRYEVAEMDTGEVHDIDAGEVRKRMEKGSIILL